MSQVSRILAVMALMLAAAAAPAQQVHRAGGVAYVSGGVGSDARQDLMLALPDYNLRVTTAAQGSGAFLAGVEVEIVTPDGVPLMSTVMEGPILLARLPTGSFQLRARYGGRQTTRAVTITGRGARDLFLYWSDTGAEVSETLPAARPVSQRSPVL